MTSQPLLRRRDGAVEIWTLNRPAERNVISGDEMITALESAAAEVNRGSDTAVVILTGAGKAFSAGGNVKDMRDRAGMFAGGPAELRQGYRHGIQRITLALHHCEVPLIAAVNGPAVGAGCDLALMCDLRVASTDAVFAESFVKLGLIPGDGGSWLLPRVIGQARAAEMAYTGEPISASTALEWGLVSQVTAPGALLPAALELAQRVAANPAGAVRMTKKLLRESGHQSIESHLETAAAYQAIAHHTGEHRDAVVAAFGRARS